MRTLLIVFVWTTALMAQHPRDDWKMKPFDLDVGLNHSLADAPLTRSERDQIYRIVDEDVHDSLGDAERGEERKAIMSFRVGSIALSQHGSRQVLVRGTGSFCGATGNCSMWIVDRQAEHMRLALGTEGQRLMMRTTFTRGFRDIAIGVHDSGFVEQFAVYHWDGVQYSQVDCYRTEYPATVEGAQQPVIADCH